MRPRNRGAIIQVGSALAYRSIPLQAAYCGAKHAIRGFTDSLRSELIHDKNTHPAANLFEPVPGAQNAHGPFDDMSRSHDAIATAATWLGGAGVQAVIAAGAIAIATALGLGAVRLLRGAS